MVDLTGLARRIERTEARQAIAELPARYAIAVDSRDIEAWVDLFVEDVNCGRRGKGRIPYVGFPAVASATSAMIEVLREKGLDTQTRTAEERGML